MKKLLGLFGMFIISCYTVKHVADIDIQYDPVARIDREEALIYIDTKSLSQGVEARKLEFILKNSLENHLYKFTENEKKANVILKIDGKKIQKKRVSFVTVPEETEIEKKNYNKNGHFYLSEPKSKTTYTTYKKVPVENTYELYNLQLSFIKLKGTQKTEAIKAQMEVEGHDFENNLETFLKKFVEQISTEKEVRNTRMVWTKK